MKLIASTVRYSVLIAAAAGGLSAAAAAPVLTPPVNQKPPKPPTTVSELQRATIPALRAPVAKWVSPQARVFAKRSGQVPNGFAPNAKLARVVKLPDLPGTIGATTWYVMPARGGVCISGGSAGSCIPDALARRGQLYLQSIRPVGNEPVPPIGQPVPSTVVGVLPDGATTVTATQQGGQQVAGIVTKGMYIINATDVITDISFGVKVMMPRLPGR